MDSGMIGKIQKSKRYAEEPERVRFEQFQVSFEGIGPCWHSASLKKLLSQEFLMLCRNDYQKANYRFFFIPLDNYNLPNLYLKDPIIFYYFFHIFY